MMGNSKQELTKQSKTSSNTGRKTSSTTCGEPAQPDKGPGSRGGRPRGKTTIKAEPGDGGSMLRSAVDILVGKESERIAQAMVKKTIEGNMSGARLLTDLTGAMKSKNKPPKKRYGPTEAELLAMEPQWEGPMEGDEDRDPPLDQDAA
jgi:hypothetical protein